MTAVIYSSDFCDSNFKFLQAIQYPSCPLRGYSSTIGPEKKHFFPDLMTEFCSAQCYSGTVDYISFYSLK